MKPNRMRRVNEIVKRELGQLCERELMLESGTLMTVTSVETAPDLRHATVFVSVFGDEAKQHQVMAALERKRARFQQELSEHVKLKYTPVLHFRLDHTLEKAGRVLAIIDELNVDEDDNAPPTAEDDAADMAAPESP